MLWLKSIICLLYILFIHVVFALIKKRKFEFHPLVKKLEPFSFTDYNFLQKNAFCVVSDSGTLPEEAAILKFPAVSIRTSTERPESLERGCFIMGGITEEQLLQAVEIATDMAKNENYGSNVSDYLEKDVSSTVIKIIQSYTRIIDKNIWRK